MGELIKKIVKYNYYTIKKINIKTGKEVEFDIREWIDFYKKKIDFGEFIDKKTYKCKIENNLGIYEDKFFIGQVYRLRPEQKISKMKDKEETDIIELEPNEYIGEDVMFLYDTQKKILMLQQNRFSISRKNFELLLNIDENNYYLSIEDISDSDILNKIKSRRVTNFKFRVNDMKNIDLKNLSDNTSIKSIISDYRNNKVNTLNFEFGLGRKKTKEEEINREMIEEYLRELQVIKDNVSAAKATTYENDKREILDIFDANIYDFIEYSIDIRDTIDFEEAKDKMLEYFKLRYS